LPKIMKSHLSGLWHNKWIKKMCFH
jgi:hypothetical protein